MTSKESLLDAFKRCSEIYVEEKKNGNHKKFNAAIKEAYDITCQLNKIGSLSCIANFLESEDFGISFISAACLISFPKYRNLAIHKLKDLENNTAPGPLKAGAYGMLLMAERYSASESKNSK